MKKYSYKELKTIFNSYGFEVSRYDDYRVAWVNSKTKLAKELGISRPTLNLWIEKFADDYEMIMDEHLDMLASGDTTMLEDLQAKAAKLKALELALEVEHKTTGDIIIKQYEEYRQKFLDSI